MNPAGAAAESCFIGKSSRDHRQFSIAGRIVRHYASDLHSFEWRQKMRVHHARMGLAAATALAVTACGGGGGTNVASTPPPPRGANADADADADAHAPAPNRTGSSRTGQLGAFRGVGDER